MSNCKTMFYKDEKTLLLIDGANLFSASRSLKFDIDYSLLRSELAKRCRLHRAIYYTVMLESDEYSPIRPLMDWLNYNGYLVRKKVVREFSDAGSRRKVKGSFDVEFTIDALAHAENVDHIVLFTGDGDFTALIPTLQQKGVRVSVVSTLKTESPMIADDLRRAADNFIELDDLRELIGRAIKEDTTTQ